MKNQTNDLIKTKKWTWNKGKLIGQKSPLTPPQVWAIPCEASTGRSQT